MLTRNANIIHLYIAKRRYTSDVENVMSVASAACVKFLSLGKILAFNIRCFVKNVVSVKKLAQLLVKLYCKGRIYCEKFGKKGQKGFISGYNRGMRLLWLIKMVIFALFALFLQFMRFRVRL